MTTLAVVPARGGSKGLPRKNLRVLRGRTLVARAVRIGLETCTRTLVTSDDPRINQEAVEAGAGFVVRPSSLAADDTPMLPVVQHAIKDLRGDVIVLLQPTQPLRTAAHVRSALALLRESGADSVVSVVEVPAHHRPAYVGTIESGRIAFPPATRRQEVPPVYSRDGTVYAIRREVVEAGSLYGTDCRALVIPPDQSVNIDDEYDFRRAESMVTS